jgi:DegV family protein with EDD domain
MSAAYSITASSVRVRPVVSARLLRSALIAGASRIIDEREGLNRINVFPVPDGDTGNNLAFTWVAIREALMSARAKHVGQLLQQAANAAVDGARGNSGAIFAQYLQGIAESLAATKKLTLSSLARAVEVGESQARKAISKPVEGTVLSVMGAITRSLRESTVRGVDDMRGGFQLTLAAAREALEHTPTQLAALRKAGVVDAGARGLVALLEGIESFLRNGRAVRAVNSAAAPVLDSIAANDHMDGHRWCTECVLSATSIDRDAVRAALECLPGSSLVMAGTREKLRVHMHLDEPAQLFDLLERFGEVRARKADDMLAQQRATQAQSKVVVVIDSAADVPSDALETLPLHMVSARVNVGATDYLDKVSLSSADFYELLSNSVEPVRTSQPPSGDFRRLFEFLLSHHEEVLYVGLSRSLSGTLQAGETAAAGFTSRVKVVDTRNVSGGEGLLALHAAERAAAGAEADDIIADINALSAETRTFAYVRDLTCAVRGGRIPAWALPITRLLRIVPLVAAGGGDGRLHVKGVTFDRAGLPARVVAKALRTINRNQRWRAQVMHCDNPAEGHAVRDALIAQLPGVDCAPVIDAGSAIGAHAGRGAVVFSLMPDRRQR